jgi:choline dehydrogenase-like flavoprotein
MPQQDRTYDVIVIGSGFGGSMAAHALVSAGRRVLMLERGGWVARGPENWAAEGVGELTEHYSTETPYQVEQEAGPRNVGAYFCVGGPSVFYGGVSLRYRERDFESQPEIVGDSGARWPFGYSDLEPYYGEAEQIIGVAGAAHADPTDPLRSAPFPQPPAALAPPSAMIERAAKSLGLRPFPLPLALNYQAADGRAACRSCPTCDGFACAVGAKNDLATAVLPALVRRGMELRSGVVVTRLRADGRRIEAVEAIDRRTGEQLEFRGRAVVLAAGALASPHIVLASELQRLNPGGGAVGRYLMRHYNEIVFGLFARAPGRHRRFHKQLGIHDFYFGHPSRGPAGKLGALQQLPTPPSALVRANLPRYLAPLAAPLVDHLTGLLVIAEDQPQFENRVHVDDASPDRWGMPRLLIRHRYTPRDREAGRTLAREARRILRRAGALALYRHRILTFSHAVGTMRMGTDPATSVLDEYGRFRGVDNLHVVDGSALPTSAGVNPSLTIAANALRSARRLAEMLRDSSSEHADAAARHG